MRKCSTYSGVSGCWGVSFTPPYTCLLKGRGISFDLDDLQSEPGSTLGLVWPTSQMEPLSSVLPECSYRNGSVIFSSTMKFEIFCNSDLDAPAWVSGTLNVPNKHFNSFDQCLAYCELGGQPQCQAVVFDPTLSSGYLNCIPKMVSIQNVSMALVPQTDPLRHAAVAIVPELNESCVDGPIDQLFNDKRFSLSCDQEITGNQIGERFRTNSLKDCIAACAERIGSSSSVGECTAVTWDPNMQEHYANCYLHLSPWKPSRMDGMISALLTKDQVTPDETAFVPAGHSVNGKSNTWIAGAVIGPVAFAVILACLIWFCIRGRGQMPRQTDMNLPEVIEPAELDQTTRDTRSPAEFDGENSRVEVDSQALREIDSQGTVHQTIACLLLCSSRSAIQLTLNQRSSRET